MKKSDSYSLWFRRGSQTIVSSSLYMPWTSFLSYTFRSSPWKSKPHNWPQIGALITFTRAAKSEMTSFKPTRIVLAFQMPDHYYKHQDKKYFMISCVLHSILNKQRKTCPVLLSGFYISKSTVRSFMTLTTAKSFFMNIINLVTLSLLLYNPNLSCA